MKKIITTKLITFITILCIFSSFSLTTFAAEDNCIESTNSTSTIAKYDLSCGETRTFTLLDSENCEYYVTIEPLDAASRVAAGSYKVTHTVPNYWTGSFTITISNNKITSAKNLNVSTSHPNLSMVSKSLTKNSSTLATCSLKYRLYGISKSDGFKAYISNGSLYSARL